VRLLLLRLLLLMWGSGLSPQCTGRSLLLLRLWWCD
jgi:hypothetical protein